MTGREPGKEEIKGGASPQAPRAGTGGYKPELAADLHWGLSTRVREKQVGWQGKQQA